MILCTGIGLRFFHAFQIPFTHDELSALYRLQFDSFSALIQGGVKVDGHPALVQVFLYYWTRWVGLTEFWVKLPFLSLGVGSIYLLYRLGKLWFNSSTALVAATFLATLQFPIMFSQIARPYISGLFFSLLLVIYWTRFLFYSKQNTSTSIGLIISAVLCSYNHYFSLMFAGIVGLTGFFFITKKNYRMYLVSMGVTSISFLPHLHIFLFQFSGKGLDWLGVPSPLFVLEHIKFILHFSPWVYVSVIILFGIIFTKRWQLTKFQRISIIWFLLPLIIGIGYSIVIKPVIQHSMLLFTFPFFILFISSFISDLKFIFKMLLVLAIIGINSITLIHTREHYSVFYHQPFPQFYNFSKNVTDAVGLDDCEVFLEENPNYLNFYFDTSEVVYTSFYKKTPSPHLFRKQLQKNLVNHIVLGNISKELVLVAKEIFPYIVAKEEGLNYTLVHLSKQIPEHKMPVHPIYETAFLFDSKQTSWVVLDPTDTNNEVQSHPYPTSEEQEYGPVLELDLNDILKSRHTLINVSMAFESNHLKNGLIALSLYKDDTEILWRGSDLDLFCSTDSTQQKTTAYLSVSLTSVIKPSDHLEGYSLKILYWNKDHTPITIQEFKMEVLPGNNIEFATIEPIP